MSAIPEIKRGSNDPSMASERDREVLRSFARRIDPSDAGAHNNLGVLYFNKGLYEEAVGAFMRALELDPRMQVAQRNLEMAYLSSGAADERILQLREELRVSPSDREHRWELGRTLSLLGRHQDAVAEFKQLLRYHPHDLAALIQLGLSEKEIGDIEVAQSWFEQALGVDPNSSLVYFYLGEIEYNRGLLEEALGHLQQAIELNPENHEAWYLLGFVLGDAGLVDDAKDATERAIQLNPTLGKAQANLAISPEQSKYVEKTKRENARVVQMEVRDEAPLTHFNLGLAFRKKGYFAEALAEYELALLRNEDRDLVEQAMAEVYLLNRMPARALKLYEGLLARQPQSPKLWNERGVALHQEGRYLDAQESYRRAIAADPDYALALNNLGVALYHAGDAEKSFDSFRRALEAHGGFIKARLNTALLLWKGKRLELALEAYRKVLSVSEEHPVAWNGVGLVLSELRKFGDARNAFARAIQSRPNYAEAHYNLSFALSNLGDFEGALRETKRALELDPYYVAQKFELAIDLQFEDADLTIQPNLGEEKRADEKIEDFQFDAKILDSVFTDLAAAPRQSTRTSVIATLPTESDPFAMAADFLSKGFYDRAHAEIKRALSRGADKSRAAALLGDVFARQGLWGEALERYREARRESPELIQAMTGEATALLRLGRGIEARRVAESVLQRRSEDIEVLMLAASARGEAGDPAAALSALDTARRVAPMRADVHKHIGDIARKLGDTEGAIAAYRNALSLDSQFAIVRYQLAQLFIERKELREAEQQLIAALDAVPTYGEATLALAALRREVGRPDEALPLLIDLLQGDPYHFDALISLGETLLALDRKQDALFAFARVLRFDPYHVGALFHEGALLAEQHRYREAIDRWREVIELQPTSDYARRARREIRTAGDLQRIFGARVAS